MYGLQKLIHLFERQNPTINTIVNKNDIANEERFSVVDKNFMMAFAVENYLSAETFEDSSYLKWVAVYTSKINGKTTNTEMEVYECTEQDFQKFYPIVP